MELTIKGKVYKFKAGMGFLRDISKMSTQTAYGVQLEIGLETAVIKMGAMKDLTALAMVLDLLNKYAGAPRLTLREIDEYLEDEETDTDALLDEVLDFLSKANVCKQKVANILKDLEPAAQA